MFESARLKIIRPNSRAARRSWSAAAVCLLILSSGLGQRCAAESLAEQLARWELEKRISSSRPHRIDSPLREQNVTDEEVREIQSASSEILPNVIVNISGVSAGCRCEDGPNCTAQAWVTAFRNGHDEGLQLSDIGGHWIIGPVQRWWLKYDQLEAKSAELGRRDFAAYLKFRDTLEKMRAEFPKCPLNFKTSAKPSAVSSPKAGGK